MGRAEASSVLGRPRPIGEPRTCAVRRSTPPTGPSGAKMVPFGGWEMPLAYPGGTIAEHLTCREDAVAFDVSHLGTVRVSGPEARARLQAR